MNYSKISYRKARAREDYSFDLGDIKRILPDIRRDVLDFDPDTEYYKATLYVGYLGVTFGIIPAFVDSFYFHEKDKTPLIYPTYHVKEGYDDGDWVTIDDNDVDMGQGLDTANGVLDWASRGWKGKLERKMFDYLSDFAEWFGYRFDKPNKLHIDHLYNTY